MTVPADQTIIDPAHDVEFTAEQHEIWRALFARQQQQVHEYACNEYLDGAANLQLPLDRIPSVQWLNERITPRTGWKTLRTRVRYSDAVQWYNHFARREFLVTDYVRTADELDFTPEPDMFHDVFGHLPYFTLKRYVEIQEMFAPAFLPRQVRCRAGECQAPGVVQYRVWTHSTGRETQDFRNGADLFEG